MIFRIKLPDIDDKNKRLVTIKNIYKKIRMKKITKARNNKCKIDKRERKTD